MPMYTDIKTQTYKCGLCKDTGRIVKQVSAEEAYGATMKDWPPIQMDAPCPRCGYKPVYDDCGFPKSYSEADMSKFHWDIYGQDLTKMEKLASSFWKNYSSWSMTGNGLYIWSKTRGTGKTYLGCCLARSVREKHKIGVKFITAVDYLELVSERYDDTYKGQDKSRVYRECELLVLDDFGAESRSRKTNWTDKEFYRLLGGRFSQGKVTIITSNTPLSDLDIDDRISSRVNAKSIIVKLPEVSIRTRNADADKKAFIDKVLSI